MSDRYRDSRDYDDFDGNANSGRRRTAGSARGGYDRSAQRPASSYSRDSGNYRATASTRSSDGAGAYASGHTASRSSQRRSQGNDAHTRRNVFEGYYPEDTVDTYRRSAYGSGSSSTSDARRYARPSAQPSRRSPSREQAFTADSPVVPAQTAHGSRGSQGRAAQRHGEYAPKRSNRKRNVIIAVVVVLAVVLVGAGAAWAYVRSIDENLHRGVTQETLDALEPAEGQLTETSLGDTPFYMLFLGTDTGEWRRENQTEISDSVRSDSMILARIDPVNKKVALISIHRDTMVDMGEYGQQKINAAYQYWGPAGAIQAVSTMAGVPISHYASVDFDGFSAIVDSLGGVDVNVPMEINDGEAGGHLDAGQQTLNGQQALILCRSRHTYDDVADDGDVMRAANQRMVIGAIAKKALSSDIMTIATTVQAMSKYVTTDLAVSDIVGLAQIFQGVNPDNDIYTAMEPTTSAYIDETWYEYLDEEAWREMIQRMDQGLPPINKTEIDERTGVVLSTGGADAPVV